MARALTRAGEFAQVVESPKAWTGEMSSDAPKTKLSAAAQRLASGASAAQRSESAARRG
jgi:hypothetical protein